MRLAIEKEKKNEIIILKFSCRKDCQNIINAKKKFRKFDVKEIGFRRIILYL